MILAPPPLDYEAFSKEPLEARWGLPRDIKFCSICVISNQRPNSTVEYEHNASSSKRTIALNSDGICDACKLAEQKNSEVDWSQREQELWELCDRFRSKDGSYDCLVPGSGGKDSFMQSHLLKEKFGMHPLTVTWAPHIYTEWGWKNFQAWLSAGFDNYLHTPNPRTHRLLTRLAVDNLFHPFQPFILGQKAFAPKIAAQFNIPLIFYGENEAEYGNPIAENFSSQRSGEYFTRSQTDDSLFLGGVSLRQLKLDFGLSQGDLEPYLPASREALERTGVQVHYLGYYIKWHPQGAYYYAVENGGFQPAPERTPGTYSKYNSIDDKIDDYHYYTTFIKFGIGRATYDASQEIRNGEITREEALSLVKKFDGEYPLRFESEIFDYLSISRDEFPVACTRFEEPIFSRAYFDALADSFRSPHIWRPSASGEKWELRGKVWEK